MFSFFLQDVPFSKIRHNDLPCYHKEGYGGRPIEEWPMHMFFKEYVSGEKEKATQNFERWYHEQLDRYHHTPKAEGGMYKGSLYTLIEKRSGKRFEETSETTKDEAIRERVQQRFMLLDTIRTHGYNPDRTEPIHAVNKNGLIHLVRGHHRAAVLHVLGIEVLPRVLVFPNQFIYNLVRFVRNR